MTTRVEDKAIATLKAMVETAMGKGHMIEDVDDSAMVAPGVFAHCIRCGGALRFYQGIPCGEAYYTFCPVLADPAPHAERTASLNEWRDAIIEYAREKGWPTEASETDIGHQIALMHSELSEAYEEYRKGHPPHETYYNEDKPTKPEGIPSEIADLIIRALHFCGIYGIDADAIVLEKHEYNLTRPYRHGNKVS